MTTIPADSEAVQAQRTGYLAKYLTKSMTEDLPAGRAVVALPVGAIVTDAGHVFAVEPLDVAVLPVRVRCQLCPWQTTTAGLALATDQATRHALAHLADPR